MGFGGSVQLATPRLKHAGFQVASHSPGVPKELSVSESIQLPSIKDTFNLRDPVGTSAVDKTALHFQISGPRPVETLKGGYGNYRYKGAESGIWDIIQERALQEIQSRRTKALQKLYYEKLASKPGGLISAFTDMTIVILVLSAPCNPLHLGEVDVLKRAKVALEVFSGVSVVAAVVVPHASKTLRAAETAGEIRHFPFHVRMNVAKAVIKASGEDSWIMIDGCQEGCLAGAPGDLLGYLREYAKSRLYEKGSAQPLLVEVLSEDSLAPVGHVPLVTAIPGGSVRNAVAYRVIQDHTGAVPNPPGAITVRWIQQIIVEVPKMGPLLELLQASRQKLLASLAKAKIGVDVPEAIDTLRRLIGNEGAGILRDWAATCRPPRTAL